MRSWICQVSTSWLSAMVHLSELVCADYYAVRSQGVSGRSLQIGDGFVQVSLRFQLHAARVCQSGLPLEHQERGRLACIEFSLFTRKLLLVCFARGHARTHTRFGAAHRL